MPKIRAVMAAALAKYAATDGAELELEPGANANDAACEFNEKVWLRRVQKQMPQLLRTLKIHLKSVKLIMMNLLAKTQSRILILLLFSLVCKNLSI